MVRGSGGNGLGEARRVIGGWGIGSVDVIRSGSVRTDAFAQDPRRLVAPALARGTTVPATKEICGVTKHGTCGSEQVFQKSSRNLVKVLSGSLPYLRTRDFWKIPARPPVTFT